MSFVDSLGTRIARALIAAVLSAGAAGCSRTGDGSIAVQLVYPGPAASASAPGTSVARASVRVAAYPTAPDDRILVRVLAPHIPAPIEKWFRRSDGRGVVDGIPPGTRIAVEVDEYDNTATALLGRGWYHGITLSAGETKTVPLAMYAKGTIVTVCGAPADNNAGTPGDTGDGGLDNEARLGSPVSVKVGPDDSVYVSSSAYGKVRRIDRYGYVSTFAGTGAHGTIVPGTPAAASPIGAVSDIDLDPAGNVYLFNVYNQIVRVDNGVVQGVPFDNGVENPAARFDLAAVNTGLLYFVNYLDRRVYRLDGSTKSEYVMDNTPYSPGEPFDRNHYPLRAPSSVTYAAATDSLVFADTDNDRVMRLSFANGFIYHYAGYPGGSTFVDNIDASSMTLVKPRVVDYNPYSGNIFFLTQDSDQIYFIDAFGKVHLFAGNGVRGFSGDGGPATAALLNDPRGVAVDSRGNAYIADNGNHALRMVVGGALP